MEKRHYEITINAPKETVWDTMLNDETYREWTKPFNPGSYFEGTWEEGSKMLFKGVNEEGELYGGMVSRIAENRPHDFVSIEHVGILNLDGTEDTTSEEVKKWTPAFENYTFEEVSGGTKVSVDIDISEEYAAQFDDMWPKALEKLKVLAEKQ
jgi:hypothetical protein